MNNLENVRDALMAIENYGDDQSATTAMKARDELEAYIENDGWLPIETAPKDGNSVIIFDMYKDKVDGYGIVVARFDAKWGWLLHQRNGVLVHAVNPVVWKPLPEPPKQTERNGDE